MYTSNPNCPKPFYDTVSGIFVIAYNKTEAEKIISGILSKQNISNGNLNIIEYTLGSVFANPINQANVRNTIF